MMMGFGLIVPLLLIGAIAYALGWRPQFNQTRLAQTSQTPLEILKARYARGDLAHRLPVSAGHADELQLLVSVMLSAQCTDAVVNQVTPTAFGDSWEAGDLTLRTAWEVGDGPDHMLYPSWVVPNERERWAPLCGNLMRFAGTPSETTEADKSPWERKPPRFNKTDKEYVGTPVEKIHKLYAQAAIEPDEVKRALSELDVTTVTVGDFHTEMYMLAEEIGLGKTLTGRGLGVEGYVSAGRVVDVNAVVNGVHHGGVHRLARPGLGSPEERAPQLPLAALGAALTCLVPAFPARFANLEPQKQGPRQNKLDPVTRTAGWSNVGEQTPPTPPARPMPG